MAIYSAVNCWEIRGTATSSIGLTGNGASVTLGCAWGDRFNLATDLLANRRVFPGYGGTGAPRVSDITSIEGWGESTLQAGSNDQIFDWEEARVSVDYEPLAAQIPADPSAAGYDLILETLEGQVDGKRLDHRTFFWGLDGPQLLPNESPVLQLRRMQIAREFIGMATIPSNLGPLIGKTNNATWNSTILGLPFPPETLLFNFPLASQTIRSDGASGWNIKLSLSYKEEGWNKFWRIASGSYEEMYKINTVGGQDVYKQFPPVDMSGLLF